MSRPACCPDQVREALTARLLPDALTERTTPEGMAAVMHTLAERRAITFPGEETRSGTPNELRAREVTPVDLLPGDDLRWGWCGDRLERRFLGHTLQVMRRGRLWVAMMDGRTVGLGSSYLLRRSADALDLAEDAARGDLSDWTTTDTEDRRHD